MSEKSKKTVSQKITELGELVAWFEGDAFVLEAATERFEAAQHLADEIEQDLANLKNEIVVVQQKFDTA